jgi:hypothetical protein
MKISVSIASMWWRGQKDVALSMLNNKDIEHPLYIEKAFSYGKGAHTAWEMETKQTGKLPAIFKLPDNFKVIATEKKITKKINETDWLSGKVDAVAIAKIQDKKVGVIIDYKTGSKSDRWQSCVYHYLMHNSPWWNNVVGVEPGLFIYCTMDKITGDTHNEIIKLTKPESAKDYDAPDATTLTTGENFILTVIEDIKNYLEIPL